MEDKNLREDFGRDSELNQKNPFFNFADASLERIDELLKNISKLSLRLDIPIERRQEIKIGLVKNLLYSSLPLSPEEITVDLKKEVLSIRPKISNKLLVRSGRQTALSKIVYSEEIEDRLNEIIIEISMALQKKGYFMPKKKSSLF